MAGVIIGQEVVQVREENGDLVTGSIHVQDDGSVVFRPVPEVPEGQEELADALGVKADAPEGSYQPGEETGT